MITYAKTKLHGAAFFCKTFLARRTSFCEPLFIRRGPVIWFRHARDGRGGDALFLRGGGGIGQLLTGGPGHPGYWKLVHYETFLPPLPLSLSLSFSLERIFYGDPEIYESKAAAYWATHTHTHTHIYIDIYRAHSIRGKERSRGQTYCLRLLHGRK